MNETQGSIEEQLELLYAEREWLAQEIGCCDAESVVGMIRNLESQLCDMYQTYGNTPGVSSQTTLQLLQYVQELSQHLDQMYSEKSITFQIEDDKPVVKANWREVTKPQGDAQ